MSELPKGWIAVKIGDVLQPQSDGKLIHQGWSPRCHTEAADIDDWGVLKTTAIQDGLFLEEHNKKLPEDKEPRERVEVHSGDLLMTNAGPRARCGITTFVKDVRPKLMLSGKMYRMRFNEKYIYPRFIEACLRSEKVRDEIDNRKTGMSESGLNLTQARFLTVPFLLAPYNEQIRIANKLDSILAKVDKAQARLDKIPAILKRFRQSVLAAATSGELTKEWRAENPSAISNSILDELSSFKFDARTKKLVDKEIRPDEISNDLPSGWKWVRLCGITDVVSGVAKGSKTKEKTVSLPYLRVANVQRGYLDLSEVKYIDVAQSKGENLKLEKGDVLFNEGGDIDKLGRGWIWEGQIEDCIHQNHVFRARVLSKKVQPKYLSFYGNESARDYFLREGTQTVNLANLNKTTLSLLPVPLPPEEEQVEIVRQVDRLLNKANKVEKQYLKAKARLDRLTQSILAKAFRGELVPQDPNDESAEKLLERILAEKEQNQPKKATRKRATKAKTTEKE